MFQMKQFSLVIIGILITATAMAAIVAEQMKVVTVCKDVRVGMDGGIGAAIESGGLTPHMSVSLFIEHYRGHDKLKTVAVNRSLSQSLKHDVFTSPEAPEFKLVVANNTNSKGRFPASLEANVDGKKVAIKLACTK
jgi:hypothetical protein